MIRIWTAIFLLLQLVTAEDTAASSVVPHRYVIEFNRPIHSFASKRHVHSKRSIFYEQLKVHNINYDIKHEYDVINAVSIEFKSPRDSALFFEKALDIKRAWPVV